MKNLYKREQVILSPENLEKYIKVTTPRVWVITILSLLILILMLIWSVVGRVEITTDEGVKEVAPITFVTN